VVAGENFGQGSAREHAVMAPMSIGMKVVIAKSFARIYRQNMISNGLVPLVFKNAADYGSIQKRDFLFIDRLVEQLQKGRVVVENRSRENTFETILDLTPRERDLILEGGLLRSLREKTHG
jgi:aconitate hydratase